MNALDSFRAAEVHTVDLGGIPVAYRRFGSGPPIVLVHGWPLSGVTYRHLVADLRETFTCIVPDLPGAGDTPWSASVGETFTGLGRLVAELVEALELPSVAFIGQDSGATFARIAAAQLGERVYALALTNTETPSHVPDLIPLVQKVSRIPMAATMFQLLLRSSLYRRSALGFGGAFSDPERIEGEFFETSLEPLLRDASGAVEVIRATDLSMLHRLDEIHARVLAPTLFVWGDGDPFFPLANAEAMVDAWPLGRACLKVVSGAKLLVHEEAPDVVLRHFRPFLEAHARPRVGLTAA